MTQVRGPVWNCWCSAFKLGMQDINPVLLPSPLKQVGTHVKVILVAYETQLIEAHKISYLLVLRFWHQPSHLHGYQVSLPANTSFIGPGNQHEGL